MNNVLNLIRDQILRQRRREAAQLVAIKTQRYAVYRGVPYEIK